jgi:hypothetical protein
MRTRPEVGTVFSSQGYSMRSDSYGMLGTISDLRKRPSLLTRCGRSGDQTSACVTKTCFQPSTATSQEGCSISVPTWVVYRRSAWRRKSRSLFYSGHRHNSKRCLQRSAGCSHTCSHVIIPQWLTRPFDPPSWSCPASSEDRVPGSGRLKPCCHAYRPLGGVSTPRRH